MLVVINWLCCYSFIHLGCKLPKLYRHLPIASETDGHLYPYILVAHKTNILLQLVYILGDKGAHISKLVAIKDSLLYAFYFCCVIYVYL